MHVCCCCSINCMYCCQSWTCSTRSTLLKGGNVCRPNVDRPFDFIASVYRAYWIDWKLAQVVNSHLVCDPTIPQPGFDLPRQQRSLLNRFRTEQGHCGACRRIWRLTDTDLCPCGETQTMFHIVESCPLTKLNGGLSRLHSADEDAVLWLTSYGWWHACEKKNESTAFWERSGIYLDPNAD